VAVPGRLSPGRSAAEAEPALPAWQHDLPAVDGARIRAPSEERVRLRSVLSGGGLSGLKQLHIDFVRLLTDKVPRPGGAQNIHSAHNASPSSRYGHVFCRQLKGQLEEADTRDRSGSNVTPRPEAPVLRGWYLGTEASGSFTEFLLPRSGTWRGTRGGALRPVPMSFPTLRCTAGAVRARSPVLEEGLHEHTKRSI
jgi:hypothetical protein